MLKSAHLMFKLTIMTKTVLNYLLRFKQSIKTMMEAQLEVSLVQGEVYLEPQLAEPLLAVEPLGLQVLVCLFDLSLLQSHCLKWMLSMLRLHFEMREEMTISLCCQSMCPLSTNCYSRVLFLLFYYYFLCYY